jgi:shikimate dehydrogenase
VIDGKTNLTGLLGWPVEHSLSPALHNAAFAALGLNWVYLPLRVLPEHLPEALPGLARSGFKGLNITIPHKQAVLPLLDEISPTARALGAVNTISIQSNENGDIQLRGDNTDVEGFLYPLQARGLQPQSAVVVGAGGAARAVIYALLQLGVRKISLLNRNPIHAYQLVEALQSLAASGVILAPLPFGPSTLVEVCQSADLLVNTTPLGMWPQSESCIWPLETPIPNHITVYDLVYNPYQTRLLQIAQGCGASAIGGLEMLVRQAAAAFQIWTGQTAPIEAMLRACPPSWRNPPC